jgi:hypothetical protein
MKVKLTSLLSPANVVSFYCSGFFARGWLFTGSGPLADLDSDKKVEFNDYGVFAGYWRDYCR